MAEGIEFSAAVALTAGRRTVAFGPRCPVRWPSAWE